MAENPPGHFLGSIICINSTKDAAAAEQELELVDGQQRLTTISMLYAVIHRFLDEHRGALDEDAQDDLRDTKRRLVLRRTEHLRLSPSSHGQNHDDYRAVLGDCGILDHVQTPKNAGNRRIFKAYRHFWWRLTEGQTVDGSPYDVEAVLHLLHLLNRSCVVKIEVSTHADAYTLFESLNNRGVPLSAIDLIKNKMLAELEKQKIGTLDHNFERWNQLLENLGDDYLVQERFLRHFYNAFRSDPSVAVDRIPFATKSKIMPVYQSLIDRNAKHIFDRLDRAAATYARLVNPDHEENSETERDLLHQVARIGGAPCYSFLLYLLLSNTRRESFEKILRFMVCFFIRRSVTDIPPTRDLDRMFMDLSNQASAHEGDLVEWVASSIQAKSASDDVFRERLMGPMYEHNAGATRFVLCALEEHQQTKETMTNLWQRNGKKVFIWTVEHIFPQGENIPADWVVMMANGDAEHAEELRGKHVHKLGNLTLSGYNSKLGNMSFEKKRDRTDRDGKQCGYRNGLAINRELTEAETWSVEAIEKRTIKMVEQIVALFDFGRV